MIKYAQAPGFAVLSVVNTLFMVIQFSDLGLGSGVINAQSSTVLSERQKHAVIASTIRILCVVALVLVLVAVSGVTIFSWSTVLGISGSPIPHMDIAACLAIVIFAVALPLNVSQRILTGLSKNHLAITLSVITSVVALVVVAGVYVLHLDAAIMSTAQSCGILATGLVSCWYAFRASGFNLRAVFDRQRYRATGLLGGGVWMLIVSVSLAIVFQSGRLILAHNSSDEELAVYSLAMQFYLPTMSIISAAGLALWPVFSARRGSASESGFEITKLTLVFVSIGLAFALGFGLLGNIAADVVSGGQVHFTGLVLVSVYALIVIQSGQIVPGMYLTTPSGLKFQAVCCVIGACLSISMGWLLSSKYGAAGPVLGTAIAVLLAQAVPTYIKASRHKVEQ